MVMRPQSVKNEDTDDILQTSNAKNSAPTKQNTPVRRKISPARQAAIKRRMSGGSSNTQEESSVVDDRKQVGY